jgi:hypothetical protein
MPSIKINMKLEVTFLSLGLYIYMFERNVGAV